MKNFFPSEPWRDAEAGEYDLPLKQPPVSILDIGANVGAFALRYAEKYPSATIFAYEPVPETFERLLAETDAFDNIRPFNFAVREMAGVAEMKEGDRDVTCSFYNLGRQTNKSIVVRIAAAKDLPSGQLVKVDTEGCELEILTHLDLSKTLAVVCEYHLGDSEQIIRLMTNNPRKVVGLEGYGLKIAKRIPIEVKPNPRNIRYLKTKKERLGHLIGNL